MQTEFKSNGHKKNHLLQIRLDIQEKERLEALAIASGFKSISDYVRVNILNPNVKNLVQSLDYIYSELDQLQKNISMNLPKAEKAGVSHEHISH